MKHDIDMGYTNAKGCCRQKQNGVYSCNLSGKGEEETQGVLRAFAGLWGQGMTSF